MNFTKTVWHAEAIVMQNLGDDALTWKDLLKVIII